LDDQYAGNVGTSVISEEIVDKDVIKMTRTWGKESESA
jgi:hypothetical protein